VKKYTKVLALALALTMLLSMSVFAAGTIDEVSKTDDPEAAKVTIENQANLKGEDKLALSYDGGVGNAGAMYLLLVLDDEGFEDEGVPTAGNIKYVNQATADAQGVATFDSIYPSDITKSTIYLAGGSLGGLTDIVNIDPEAPEYAWGDVDLSTIVDTTDAMLTLRHALTLYTITGDGLALANVDGSAVIDTTDAMLILRKALTLIDKFPVEE